MTDFGYFASGEELGPLELIAAGQAAEAVSCGNDPGRAAEAIREYVDAGFDEVFIAQMGPRQEEGIRFIVDEVLPLV